MALIDDLMHMADRPVETPRQERARMAFDMYRGDQEPYIARNPDEDPREFAARPKEWLNVTRLVMDILSGLYAGPVRRRVIGDDALDARMRRVWRANGMDTFLLHADRLARTTGTVAVRPFYDERDAQIAYWAYSGHMVDAISDPERPWRAVGVVIRWSETDAMGRALRRAHVWTEDRFVSLINGRTGEQRSHAYGRVPIAFLSDAPARIHGLFPPGRGWDVAEANATLNMRLSDDLYTLKMQGFGVAEIVNPMPDQSLSLSPGRAMVFDQRPGEQAGITFKSPGAPLRELAEEIEARVKRILLANRIPESAITVSLSGTSGVAIHASHTPLETDRAERARLFAAHEQELLDVTTRVLRAHEPGAAFAVGAPLAVDFPRPRIGDPAERRAQREFEMRHGITTPWRIAVEDDPDGYTDPDRPDAAPEQIARARILENLRQMKALSAGE